MEMATSRVYKRAAENPESRMTVYAIAQLRFTDRERYNRYQARFMDVFKRFNGRLLAADEAPAVEEGQWDREKLVLMSFPDEAAWRAFADSPAYREIAADRLAGADAVVLLVKGIPG
jgi:uncharacterized protein (DUF1330 family)